MVRGDSKFPLHCVVSVLLRVKKRAGGGENGGIR